MEVTKRWEHYHLRMNGEGIHAWAADPCTLVGRGWTEGRPGVSGRSGEILTLRRSGSRSGYPSLDLRIALLLRVICRGHLTSSAGI